MAFRSILRSGHLRRVIPSRSISSTQGGSSSPVTFGLDAFETLNAALSTTFGTDWWVTMVVGAGILRLASLPLTIRYARHRERYATIAAPVIQSEAILNVFMHGNPPLAKMISANLRKDAYQKARTSFLSQIPLHIPLHMAFFVPGAIAARRLALSQFVCPKKEEIGSFQPT